VYTLEEAQAGCGAGDRTLRLPTEVGGDRDAASVHLDTIGYRIIDALRRHHPKALNWANRSPT
jgi:hypothetical protein